MISFHEYPESAGDGNGALQYFNACKSFFNVQYRWAANFPEQKPHGYDEFVQFTRKHLAALESFYPSAEPPKPSRKRAAE